jgi:peptide deformylase
MRTGYVAGQKVRRFCAHGRARATGRSLRPASPAKSGENKSVFTEVSMALLPILCYPDPRLNTVAKPVQAVDARIKSLIADMLETMYAAPGIGLAATQINVHERLIVIDVSEDHDDPLVLINPELVGTSTAKHLNEEGCLSVPGIYDGVERFDEVQVRALDGEGVSRVISADGLLAVCIQHEMDHLMGKVFVEYLSPLKRNRIKTKLAKAKREERN